MRPLVHPEHAWRAARGRIGCSPHQAQQRHPTGAQVQAADQTGTRPATQGQANRLQERGQHDGPAGVDGDKRRQPLAEDPARAAREHAAETPRQDAQEDAGLTPAQVGDPPFVPAVDG
jgi:hypothetical protein